MVLQKVFIKVSIIISTIFWLSSLTYLAKGQIYDDEVITSEGDTLSCRILFVSNLHVNFATPGKLRERIFSVPRDQLSSYELTDPEIIEFPKIKVYKGTVEVKASGEWDNEQQSCQFITDDPDEHGMITKYQVLAHEPEQTKHSKKKMSVAIYGIAIGGDRYIALNLSKVGPFRVKRGYKLKIKLEDGSKVELTTSIRAEIHAKSMKEAFMGSNDKHELEFHYNLEEEQYDQLVSSPIEKISIQYYGPSFYRLDSNKLQEGKTWYKAKMDSVSGNSFINLLECIPF